MNFKTYFFILCPIVILLAIACNAGEGKKIVISNSVISKTITTPATAGSIAVSVCDNEENIVARTTQKVPLFEFVLDGEILSSNDAIWTFDSHEIRKMLNHGEEHKLVFRGAQDPVRDLQVILYQQIFENSTLIREKLTLSSLNQTDFQLNKLEGQLHFKFPQYAMHRTSVGSANETGTEIRLASWEKKPIKFHNSEKVKFNHMYHPDIITYNIDNNSAPVKGPINITHTGALSWITAYEHASQDNLNGLLKGDKNGEDGEFVDLMQSTVGIFDFPKADSDFKFIGINTSREDETISISVDLVRGGYLEGELITKDKPYESVWTASAFYKGYELEDAKSIIRNYLFNQICEKPASRKPEFYYNTWGMQRAIGKVKGDKYLRGVMTYDNIFKEIDRASQLGVDIFVLDDGWEESQGIWTPHSKRLPEGLAPIKNYLDALGIKMGVWFSPLGIDSSYNRYAEHPEWVILDSEDYPVGAQWGHPAFDFVSDFFNLFIEDCKKLIDEGVLFFKWDAINTLYSSLPNLHHGSDEYSDAEIRARYEYLLPIYITKAMEILTDYEPDLIIEIDLTEARRVMMGLAPLSQGKLFFMNNGASGYNDYSTFRAKSMRKIAYEYNGIIPLELFTYANYPHDIENAMQYNTNTSLIAGHGFWGDLSLTAESERLEVGKKVSKSKRVLPYIRETPASIMGEVGSSPEIYEQVNSYESAGQLIVFAHEPKEFGYSIHVNPRSLLGVLDMPYILRDSLISLNFDLREMESSKAAFVIPNEDQDVAIVETTVALDDIKLENGRLEYVSNSDGTQTIRWKKSNGKPVVMERGVRQQAIKEMKSDYIIELQTQGNITIIIE